MAIVYAMDHGLNGFGKERVSYGTTSSLPSRDVPVAARIPKALPRLGSAALVVDDDGRLLLGVRPKPTIGGHWVLPGGGVQPFESLATAVEREVLEETGLIVEAREQLGVWEIVDPPDQHRVIIYSRAEIVGGTLESGGDLERATFWSRAQLPELQLTPLVSDVLRRLGWLDVTNETSPQSRHAA